MNDAEQGKYEPTEDPKTHLLRTKAKEEYVMKGLRENPGEISKARIKQKLDESERTLMKLRRDLEILENGDNDEK